MRKAIAEKKWGILIDKHGWLDLSEMVIKSGEERLPYLDVIEGGLMEDDEFAKANVVNEWVENEELLIEKMKELRKEIFEALETAGIDEGENGS